MAKTAMKIKQQRKQKFSTREYTRLQNLRTSAFCTEKIRHLPCMLPRAGLQGPDSGRKESQLVGRKQLGEFEP